jgi:hypothetical protein
MAGFRINTADGQEVQATSVSTNSTGALVAAVAGQKIRVYKMALTIAVTGTVQFADGSTNLTGAMTLNAGTPFILPHDGNAWFATSLGNAFNVSVAQQLSGTMWFTQSTFI